MCAVIWYPKHHHSVTHPRVSVSRRPSKKRLRVDRWQSSPEESLELGCAFLPRLPLFDRLSSFSCWLLSTLTFFEGAECCTTATGPGLKHRIKLLPGWLTTLLRENDLHHEWTCLFIEMEPWCKVFVTPKLFQQYGICRGHFCAVL